MEDDKSYFNFIKNDGKPTMNEATSDVGHIHPLIFIFSLVSLSVLVNPPAIPLLRSIRSQTYSIIIYIFG